MVSYWENRRNKEQKAIEKGRCPRCNGIIITHKKKKFCLKCGIEVR